MHWPKLFRRLLPGYKLGVNRTLADKSVLKRYRYCQMFVIKFSLENERELK